MSIKVITAPLSHGTLVCRGTLVENHWCRESVEVGIKTSSVVRARFLSQSMFLSLWVMTLFCFLASFSDEVSQQQQNFFVPWSRLSGHFPLLLAQRSQTCWVVSNTRAACGPPELFCATRNFSCTEHVNIKTKQCLN